MKLSIAAGCFVFIAGPVALAQDSSLIGKYSGSFQGSDGGRETRVVLNINSVDKLTGNLGQNSLTLTK